MTILALYANKGGVGKTTCAVNLAYLAAQAGYQTLICDLDAQGAASFYFRVKPKLKTKARGLRRPGKAIDRSIKGSDYDRLDILPADFSHRRLDVTFFRGRSANKRLKRTLKPLRREYDLILLDCPPTIDMVAENVFNASDYILVPLVPTTLSARSFDQLQAFLSYTGNRRKYLFSFFSMVETQKRMHKDMMVHIRDSYPRVLRSSIPYLAVIEKMGIERQPVPAFAPRSPAALAYQNLWTEIRGRLLVDRRRR